MKFKKGDRVIPNPDYVVKGVPDAPHNRSYTEVCRAIAAGRILIVKRYQSTSDDSIAVLDGGREYGVNLVFDSRLALYREPDHFDEGLFHV